ncbi:complement receptor type 1-like isoform X9 [Notamacropus eugenii]|uniref:complement receptor type 1-like isoform X9 n=1 Tax=Notamacropus eugenii TaxID=9315 RepID=UPI003B678CF6
MGAAQLLWGLLACLTPGVCGQCSSPPWLNFAVSKSNFSSAFAVGYSLTYECRPGYVTKKFNIICLENSTWSSVNDNECKRKSCGTPAELLHGRMEITSLEFGSTLNYSCFEGYQLIGHSFNQCILSGNTVIWEKEVPVCEPIRCDPPPAIPNGRYQNTKEYFSYGMVVSYECNTGTRGEKLYDLVGNKTLHCTSKDNKVGIWNSPPPRCITPVVCQTPVIANGRRVLGFRRVYGLNDAVELECNPGFTMKGSRIVRCQTNSQWQPALPVCFRGCLPPVEISHGRINRLKEHFSFGEVVSYVCEPGYFLIGTASIKCIEPGKWNYQTPKCEVKSCGVFLDQLTNGRVVSPHPPRLGTKVFFVCDEGFRLKGSSSSTCVSNEMTVFWSDKVPVCERITCGFPPPIINGRLPYLSGNTFSYGTTVGYTCYKTFRAIGTRFTRCTSENQVNGVWSAPAPRCEPYSKTAVCNEPKVLGRHLKLRSRPPYRHGDILQFACDTNFTMRGYDTLWCQADSTWGPTPVPTCESDCSSPPVIPNGYYKDDRNGQAAPGLSVTYSCEPGYLLIGEKTIHCLSSGGWNASAPKCKEALCDPLIKFPNGQIEEPSHLQIGAVMTFSCNKGYYLQGQASSKCVLATEGAVWTKIPVCTEVVCRPPPVIKNGKHTGSSTDDVPYGTKVIYKCNADPERGVKFNLIGESTIHCTSDQKGKGIWSAAAPRCELSASSIQCPLPSVPNGYKISGQGPPYFYNDSVVFGCDVGFTLKGSRQIRCSASRTWDPEVPVCQKACQPLPEIPHGQHTGRDVGLLDPGTSVNYSCDLGYSLIGEETIRCTADGVWKPAVPQCKAIVCPPPPVIENGKHTGSSADDVPYGTKVIYKCNADPERGVKFNLIGESTIHCTSDQKGKGIWSAAAPRCELSASSIQCPLPSVPNGYKISGQGPPYFYNDSVVFGCDVGFTLKGSRQIRCSASRTWDPEVPVCQKAIVCPPPPVIENGKHTGSSADDVPYGTKVIYKCNADPERGVKFNLIGESTIHCTSDQKGKGIWSAAAPRCELSASSIQCPLPSVPNGYKISGQGPPYFYNDSVVFGCDVGFTLKGSRQIRCSASRTWDPEVPVCQKACQPLPEIPHGQHTGRDVGLLDPGTSVNYSCDLGYSLIGEETIRCTADGVWKPAVPQCKAIVCPPPPVIENGKHTGSSADDVPYGTKVIYKCNADPERGVKFNLIGESTIHCTSDQKGKGIWSAAAPRCELSASSIQCPLPSVPNGYKISGQGPPYFYNDSVVFGCDVGFTLKGSRQIRCSASRTWDPEVPVCQKACQPLPEIPHGQHTGRDVGLLDPGTSVNYSCDLGYSLIGEETIRCTADGVWKPAVPQCKAIVCPPPPVIENGKHTGSSADDVPYGTKVIYKCNADPERGVKFNLIGESTIHCTSDQKGKGIWSAAAPRCELSASSIQCPLPSVPNGYKISGQGPPYFYNDSVVFGCDVGFTLKGSRQIRCSASRTWDPEVPVCQKACQPLPEIPHGQHTGRDVGLLDPGTSVNYSCDLGYSLIGEETIRCTADGVWKPAVPQCKAIVCPPPPVIENGKHTGSSADDVPYGTKVIYKCNADPERGVKFNLIGESTIHCTSDQKGKGIWSAAAPRCELSASSIQCPLPSVPNGYKISGQGPPYFYNDSVVFGCDVGFTLKGSRQIRCSASRTWDPEVPVCQKACQPLPEIPHGQHTGRDVGLLDPGTSVNYSCDLGYSLIGEETIRCTADGVWKPAVPQCKAIVCPPPPVIENGKHTGSSADDVPYGTKVIYKCNADPERGVKFNLIGESTIHCTSDQKGKGIWSAAAPRCELSASSIQCPLPSVPNGYKISGQGPPYFYNDSVVFGCDVGFTLKGSRQIRCSASRTWDPEVPVCQKACQPLPEIPHGQHTGRDVGLLDPGTSVNYSCDLGYSLIGEETIRCTADGVWKPAVPQCKAIVCPPPPVIENGKHTGSSADDVPYGTKVIYKCNADPERGVKFNLIGESTIHCTSDQKGKGIWSAAAPRCELSASSIQCPLPSVPNGYKISGQGPPYFYNDSVVFGCDVGFTLKGSRQIRCSASRTWDPEVPVCQKACQPLPEIPHGQHTGRDVGLLDPGTSVNYSCDLGYSLIGEETIRCTADGVWKPAVPQCKAIVCPPPPVIENGKHTGSSADDVPYGTKVIYKCNADPERGVKFNLIGESTIHCTSDQKGKGIWSAAAPRCELSASSIQCPLPSVPNGYKISGQGPPYFYNDSVVFGCDVGFTLKGSRQIRCSASRTWDPEVPVCQKEANCSLPEYIIGAQNVSTKKIYNFGAIFTLKCDEGYTLEGSPQSQCQKDRRWDPPLAVCKSLNFSSLVGPGGHLVLSGIILGTLLLILFVGFTWTMISKYKEGSYHTNENCKEVTIHLETQEAYNSDAYSFAT